MRSNISIFHIALIIISFYSCKSNENIRPEYQTKYVVIIVIDGPRYSETWGMTGQVNIPKSQDLFGTQGIVNTNFFNNGPTYTAAGHTAITTGNYQEINNSGKELPSRPSIFQYWLKSSGANPSSAWIVTSKDKLEVLSNSLDSDWKDTYMPMTDCGVNGLGTGYRHDSTTLRRTLEIMGEYHPNLMLINFREPDYSAHMNKWDNYIQGIRDTDRYVKDIWNFIESDPILAGTTTMFITNDHGRHLDEVANGFVSHGDDCFGCRKITLFAIGPDFKEGIITTEYRDLLDVSSTVSELLDFEFDISLGQTMTELFKFPPL